MSFVSGTGLISGGSSSSTNQVNIQVDVEQVSQNKRDIQSLTSTLSNLTTDDVAEGTKLYYTEDRVDAT